MLEHPAYSDAWGAHGLNAPPALGGWVVADFEGGWTCHVEQGRYGHRAKKATWLYAHGVPLPSLKWGSDAESASQALVSWCANHTSRFDTRPRVGKKAAAATREEFRDVLLGREPTPRQARGDRKGGAQNLGPRADGSAQFDDLKKSERAATPPEFRDVLLDMVRR